MRSSWLFGPGGWNFIEAILKQAEAGRRTLSVVNDQTGRPTATTDLAEAILALIEAGAIGIYHFANCGEVTWFDFAREILDLAGHEDVAVAPTDSATLGRPARRPAYSVLDTSRYEKVIARPVRHYRDPLVEYLARRPAGGVSTGSPAAGRADPMTSISSAEWRRKAVHAGMGLLALTLRWLDWKAAALLALTALLFNLFVLPRFGRGIYRDAAKTRDTGIVAYAAMVLVLILLFRGRYLPIAAAVWAMMAFGDPAAAIAGRLVGGPRLPWNREKTWIGLLSNWAVGAPPPFSFFGS